MIEIIILLLIASGVALWWYNRDGGVDVNLDGKVNLEDAAAAVKKTVAGAKKDAKSVAGETKRRAKRVAEESADVVKAAKQVGNQVGDVVKAVKGKSRTGRKPKK